MPALTGAVLLQQGMSGEARQCCADCDSETGRFAPIQAMSRQLLQFCLLAASAAHKLTLYNSLSCESVLVNDRCPPPYLRARIDVVMHIFMVYSAVYGSD